MHQHQQAIINLLAHLQSQTSSPASRCSIVGDLANHVCLFCCNAMRSFENIDFTSQVNEAEGAPRNITQTPPLLLPNIACIPFIATLACILHLIYAVAHLEEINLGSSFLTPPRGESTMLLAVFFSTWCTLGAKGVHSAKLKTYALDPQNPRLDCRSRLELEKIKSQTCFTLFLKLN